MKTSNTRTKLLSITALATMLGGCVTDSDLYNVQSQVNNLQRQVRALESQLVRSNEELVQTQGELAVVKKQRVVRLPTGAPTETRSRSTTAPTYAASNEETAFNQAVNQYKSGDVQGAITAFEQFNAQYPNSTNRGQSLFYLGQAAYTARDYTRAQQALEVLAFQPINGQVNQPAARLLRSVYQAQGNTADEARLNDFLQTLNQGGLNSATPVSTPSAIDAPITESSLQSPQPLRPVITQ